MSGENTPANSQQKRGIRLTVLAIFVVASVLVGSFFYSFTQARVMTRDELREQGAYLYENPRMLPGFFLTSTCSRASVAISRQRSRCMGCWTA